MELVPFLLLLGGSGLTGASIYYYYYVHKKSLSKISDAELLRTIATMGTFSASELAKKTPLTTTEAYTRLNHLAYTGRALRTVYDSNLAELYTLKEPLIPFLDEPVRDLTEQDIVYIAQQNHNQITEAHLCLVGNMTLEQAQQTLKKLKKKGLLKRSYDSNLQAYYQLKSGIQADNKLVLNQTNLNPTIQKIAQNKPLRDAAVIAVAVELGGKLSATQLCLKKDISIDEAQKLLDYLTHKNVFEIQVSENGVIQYHLIDKELSL